MTITKYCDRGDGHFFKSIRDIGDPISYSLSVEYRANQTLSNDGCYKWPWRYDIILIIIDTLY